MTNQHRDDGPKFVKLLPERETDLGGHGIRIEITIEESGMVWTDGRLTAGEA